MKIIAIAGLFVFFLHVGIAEQKIKSVKDTWAYSCDFWNHDFKNVITSSNKCGSLCANERSCTHFTWSRDYNGTCWMKNGPVKFSDAFNTHDNTMVCGVVAKIVLKPGFYPCYYRYNCWLSCIYDGWAYGDCVIGGDCYCSTV